MEIFHILNRGVDKRKIFLTEKDYVRFIHNLFVFNDHNYVNNNSIKVNQLEYINKPSFRNKRELLAYIHAFVLMPNHYHLLVTPITDDALPVFTHKINMGYSKYFNEKNKRSGALFQGKSKKIRIDNDPYYIHIMHYIHCNPLDLHREYSKWRKGDLSSYKDAISYLKKYKWSSFPDYIGQKNFPSVLHQKEFLPYFGEHGGYLNQTEKFLEDRLSRQFDSGNSLEFKK